MDERGPTDVDPAVGAPRPLTSATVRVPCSTSNLGAGFDCIGLALDLHLEISFKPGASEFAVVRKGTLADLAVPPEEDLAATAFLRAVRGAGAVPSGVLTMRSEIPVGKGLGASAAATVAGFDLGLAACGFDTDRGAILALGMEREGHGDNVAPILLGGLVAVVPKTGESAAERRGETETFGVAVLELSPEIGFAFAAPARPLSTREARKALPNEVSHATAVRSAARAVALTRGLETGDPMLLHAAVEGEELHTSHRLPLIEGGEAALRAGYAAGAWAVTTSGAGSGMIAMCEPMDADEIAEAMRRAFAATVSRDEARLCIGFALRPEPTGVRRLAGVGRMTGVGA